MVVAALTPLFITILTFGRTYIYIYIHQYWAGKPWETNGWSALLLALHEGFFHLPLWHCCLPSVSLHQPSQGSRQNEFEFKCSIWRILRKDSIERCVCVNGMALEIWCSSWLSGWVGGVRVTSFGILLKLLTAEESLFTCAAMLLRYIRGRVRDFLIYI